MFFNDNSKSSRHFYLLSLTEACMQKPDVWRYFWRSKTNSWYVPCLLSFSNGNKKMHEDIISEKCIRWTKMLLKCFKDVCFIVTKSLRLRISLQIWKILNLSWTSPSLRNLNYRIYSRISREILDKNSTKFF